MSVIKLLMIQLKAIFEAKAHITFGSSTLKFYYFRALSTQHTSTEVLIFQFWLPLFSENVFQSTMELCCRMPDALDTPRLHSMCIFRKQIFH